MHMKICTKFIYETVHTRFASVSKDILTLLSFTFLTLNLLLEVRLRSKAVNNESNTKCCVVEIH